MNECCEQPGNRRDGPGPRGLEHEPSSDVTVTHCVVCECRHFEVEADPGEFGLVGKGL